MFRKLVNDYVFYFFGLENKLYVNIDHVSTALLT